MAPEFQGYAEGWPLNSEPEPHFPELRELAEIDPEFREWLGEAACPEVQRCETWPTCSHEQEGQP